MYDYSFNLPVLYIQYMHIYVIHDFHPCIETQLCHLYDIHLKMLIYSTPWIHWLWTTLIRLPIVTEDQTNMLRCFFSPKFEWLIHMWCISFIYVFKVFLSNVWVVFLHIPDDVTRFSLMLLSAEFQGTMSSKAWWRTTEPAKAAEFLFICFFFKMKYVGSVFFGYLGLYNAEVCL